MAYPPDHPPTLPSAIEYPIVPNTPAGAEALEVWRERQAVRACISWGIPIVFFFLTLLGDALGSRLWTGLAGLVTVVSGACAPGLTVVYLLRRRKARLLAEDMPRLPRASLRLAGQVADERAAAASSGGRRREPQRPPRSG